MTKATCEERVYFNLQISIHTLSVREVIAGVSSRILESGPELQAVEEYILLACSSCLTQPPFLSIPGAPTQG